jgi:hypothetical protein
MTMRYAHLAPENLKQGAKTIEDIWSESETQDIDKKTA